MEEEMSKYPNITIICSNYNSDNWIDGYLENANVLEGAYNIIFVDANSTDGSLHKIKSWKFRSDINVKIIECTDRVPIYTAWNMAIKEAETEYVMTWNTDDRLLPSALSYYEKCLATNEEVDIFYGPILVTKDPKTHEATGFSEVAEHNHATLMENCYCGPFPLLKRKSLISAGLFNPEFTISGDYEMWARMSTKGYKFMRVPETIGVYYHNPTGMSSNSKTFAEHLRQDTIIRGLYS